MKLVTTQNGQSILRINNTALRVSGITPHGHQNITTTEIYNVEQKSTAQILEPNLISSNIRENTTILDITGNIHEGITPSGEISIYDTQEINVYDKVIAIPQISNNTLIPSNILEGKTILGVEGIMRIGIEPTGTQKVVNNQLINVYDKEYAYIEDSNLNSENIKNGINILGILGEYVGEGVVKQQKTATPNNTVQRIVPDTGYTVLTRVTINPIPYIETLDVHGGIIVNIGG